jgi:hypothetical protein
MGKKKKADLGIAMDILTTLRTTKLAKDHPDHRYQVKHEIPSLDRAYHLVMKRWLKDNAKRRAKQA